MTTVIDHAIAIPTRPANVWDMLKDVSNNPKWHPDSKRVQLLTTLKSGRGMRWRNTTKSDKEQVFEITAWYDGLGYEYRIVDGTNYNKNRGRIRLQEAPEGTVLQWTFSYETSGLLGNLRNSLSMKGHADKEIVQGLRNIYTLVKEAKADENIDPSESKAYLKEAPNVEERASYQPRYPSKVTSQEIPVVKAIEEARFKPPTTPESDSQPAASAAPLIPEPPVADDDTRPNPTIQAATETAPPETQSKEPEPEFLKTMPDPAPAKPVSFAPSVEAEETETVATEPTTLPEDTETEAAPSVPSVNETAPVQPVASVDSTSKVSSETDKAPPKPSVEPLTENRPVTKTDTATVSVFEVFGLEKPSETEKVRTLSDKMTSEIIPEATTNSEPLGKFMDSTPIIPDIQPDVPTRRRGLRATMRSRLPSVRLPKADRDSK